MSHIYYLIYIDFINVLQKINMVKLTFFLSGGSQEGADLVAPDVFEFGLSKCSFQQRVTLLFFFFILFDYLKNALIERRFWL